MPRDPLNLSNAVMASPGFSRSTRTLNRMTSSRFSPNSSPSANKYRVTTTPTSPAAAPTIERSPSKNVQRLSTPTTSSKMLYAASFFATKNSSMPHINRDAEGDTSIEVSGSAPSSPKQPARLPTQLRQRVSRLRSQFALGHGSPSFRDKTSGTVRAPDANTNAPPASPTNTNASEPQYSRRSTIMQSLHERIQISKKRTRPPKIEVGPAVAGPDSSDDANQGQEPQNVAFQDLIKPLQSSLSCGNELMAEESEEDDDHSVTSEKEPSRVVRTCCSLDNLMMSIADQMAQEKQDTAIARGAARQLMELFQYAIKQVALNCLSENYGSNQSENGDKELQYTRELLVEIAERIGRLDAIIRSALVQQVQGLESRLADANDKIEQLQKNNEQLEHDITKLRDFHANKGTSNLMFDRPKGEEAPDVDDDAKHRFSLLFPTTFSTQSKGWAKSGDASNQDQVEFLQNQCHEFQRLLEMAKQEIKLCHHERKVQKDRIAELSDVVFKDREVQLLRNELHSERRRVKFLEIENLTLRETQSDQQMKIQSLVLNCKSSTIVEDPAQLRHPQGKQQPTQPASDNQKLQLNRKSSENEKLAVEVPVQQVATEKVAEQPASNAPLQPSKSSHRLVVQENHDVVDHRPAFIRMIRFADLSHPATVPVPSFKQFISDYFLTDKHVAGVRHQTKVRRQVQSPAIGPVANVSMAATASPDRKAQRKPMLTRRKAQITEASADLDVDEAQLLVCCNQLIWLFYQRYLMAMEAQSLQQSTAYAPSAEQQVRLSIVVYEYFLERKVKDEDALADACLFMRMLYMLRDHAGHVRVFCEFLEDKRSEDELMFYLWLLQAMEDVHIGVNYDVPMKSTSKDHCGPPIKYICTLKAAFLTRSVFQLLTFKQIARKPVVTLGIAMSPRRRKSVRSPKRKRRVNGVEESQPPPETEPSLDEPPPAKEDEAATDLSLHDQAIHAFRALAQANDEYPPSMEAFNALVAAFAVSPSTSELKERMGSFYRPTGDESKVPLDVYLLLLLEMFRFQSNWQQTQLRWLFVMLSQQEEAELLDELHKKEERERMLAAARSRWQRLMMGIKSDKPLKGEKKPANLSPKKKMKKKRKDVLDKNLKYLKGLSRKTLGRFLVRGGVVADLMVVDIDRLYAHVLLLARQCASEITFDEVMTSLRKLGFLRHVGDLHLTHALVAARLDASSFSRANEDEAKQALAVSTLRELWRIQSREIIALCESDPNMFVRKQTLFALRAIDRGFGRSETWWHQMARIREFLAATWRISAKRASEAQWTSLDNIADPWSFAQTCVTEFYFANRAFHVIAEAPEFTGNSASTSDTKQIATAGEPTVAFADDLRDFFDTSTMELDDLLTANHVVQARIQPLVQRKELILTPRERRDLEHVLSMYASHFAHLFHSYATNRRFLTLTQWLELLHDLRCLHPKHLPMDRAHALFMFVANRDIELTDGFVKVHDHSVQHIRFTELLVRVAVERHFLVTRNHELKALAKMGQSVLRIARIMAAFCQDVVFPHAFHHRHKLFEEDFTKKLSCPLVARVLLEHRAFLRAVFFYYSKQGDDEDESADSQLQALHAATRPRTSSISNHSVFDSALRGFQLGKTKRNSMNIEEFFSFLREFELIEADAASSNATSTRTVFNLQMASVVFQSVMSLENADVTQLEFSEFTSAIAAIATIKMANPFTQWHVKIDAFVRSLMQFDLQHKKVRS